MSTFDIVKVLPNQKVQVLIEQHKKLLWSVILNIFAALLLWYLNSIPDFKLKYGLDLSVHDLFYSVKHSWSRRNLPVLLEEETDLYYQRGGEQKLELWWKCTVATFFTTLIMVNKWSQRRRQDRTSLINTCLSFALPAVKREWLHLSGLLGEYPFLAGG